MTLIQKEKGIERQLSEVSDFRFRHVPGLIPGSIPGSILKRVKLDDIKLA